MCTGDNQASNETGAPGSSQADLQALNAVLVEAEARTASAPRLLVQSLSIAPIHLLVDVHAAGGSRHIPITVDTHRLEPACLQISAHLSVHFNGMQDPCFQVDLIKDALGFMHLLVATKVLVPPCYGLTSM